MTSAQMPCGAWAMHTHPWYVQCWRLSSTADWITCSINITAVQEELKQRQSGQLMPQEVDHAVDWLLNQQWP